MSSVLRVAKQDASVKTEQPFIHHLPAHNKQIVRITLS